MSRAMTTAPTMTAGEFLELPVDDAHRGWQLVEGEVVVYEPIFIHGELLLRLAVAVREWIATPKGRGSVHIPADVRLDERNVYAPDVLWYAVPRDLREPRPYPMPEIAVEVRSPSTWRYDIGAKKAGYERHGLPELWLVDTEAEEILVFRRSRKDASAHDIALELAAGDSLTSPLLPGFALDVGELFTV